MKPWVLFLAAFAAQALAAPLQSLIDATPAGGTLRLVPGSYVGPVTINKPMTLDGGGKALILGSGKGTVLSVAASGVTLRGQIEVLTYEIEATQKRQKDFYVDLDNRLRKLEPPPADAKPESQVAAPKADPAQETRDYEAALAGLKASKFREAGASFVAFIKAYPNGGLTASAHYWGAYAHAQAKDHAAAAELFGKFAAGWPNDDRAPAALESRVASLEALKDWKNARATLEQLAERYPNSEAGKKAKLKLKKK